MTIESVIPFFVLLLLLIVVFSFFNEKISQIPNDIALVLFSLITGFAVWYLLRTGIIDASHETMVKLQTFRFDEFLLDGVLCFMLFSGASHLKLENLIHNFKPISLLALLTTILSSAIYGGLFWLISMLLGLNMNFTLCFLLGCIVSPTDPIAATSILNKLGLSKNVTSIMEGESLFNDGTGVALFICIRNIYMDTPGSNFFIVMGKELLGAIVVGLVVSFLLFQLIKRTQDPIKHITVSLLAVSMSYVICESLGFSGVIVSVVCGLYFATAMEKHKQKHADLDPKDYYKDFWSIMDSLLNSILYVLIGLSFIYVTEVKYIVVLAIVAIVFNLIARFVGVYLSALITWKLPDGYKLMPFTTLMTWGGLKGGLSLALALSTVEFLDQGRYSYVLYITYVTIIFTTIVQGLTTGKVYKLLQKKFFAQAITIDENGEEQTEDQMGAIDIREDKESMVPGTAEEVADTAEEVAGTAEEVPGTAEEVPGTGIAGTAERG